MQLHRDIALVGKMGSGKDFIGARLQEELGYYPLPFALPMKQEIAAQHGISLAELEANKGQYRKELQNIGQGRRAADPQHWIKIWHEYRLAIPGPVVVTDCRYINEAEYISMLGGLVVQVWIPEDLRISRLGAKYGEVAVTPEILDHPSEQEIDRIRADFWVSGCMHTEQIGPWFARTLARLYAFGVTP